MNPLIIDTIIQERKLEAQAYSEECRLVSLYNRANPGIIARTLLFIGKVLVKFGYALQQCGNRNLAIKENLCHTTSSRNTV